VNTKFVVNPLFRTSTSSFFSGWQCGWKWKWKFETKKRNAETQPTTHPHMTIQLNSTLSNCDDGSKNGMEWNGNGIGNEMKWNGLSRDLQKPRRHFRRQPYHVTPTVSRRLQCISSSGPRSPYPRTPAQDSVCNRWWRSPGLSKFRCKTMEISVSHAQLAKKLYSRQLCKMEQGAPVPSHMRCTYILCTAYNRL